MNRSGIRFIIVVGLCATAASAAAQAPYYAPSGAPQVTLPSGPTLAPPVGVPVPTPVPSMAQNLNPPIYSLPAPDGAPVAPPNAVVDPSPMYPPATPNLQYSQPPVSPPSMAPPSQAPYYRPQRPSYSAAPPNAAPTYAGPMDAPSMNSAPSYAQPMDASSMNAGSMYPTPMQPMHSAPAYSTMPGYGGGGGAGMPFAQPNQSCAPMPRGSFDRGNFATGPQMPPGPTTQWTPTYGAPFGGAMQGGYGQCGPNCEYGGCQPACSKCCPSGWCDNLSVFTAFDAFKNPVDLDGLNGNFGVRTGFNASGPLYAPWGLGAQVSGSAGWYDWNGTPYTGENYRFQNFWTAGLFHRNCANGLGFGIAYDWLFDDYWSDLKFGQWRVGGSWLINACNEIGIWAALPDNRDSTTSTGVNERFSSLLQGNAYYRHVWDCGAWTTIYGGLAESPSDFTIGSSSQAAMNDYVALFASAGYAWPSAGGTQGYQEEIWNLSVGIALYPGSARRIATSQFRPFFNPADNGNFGIWRK